MWHSYHQMQRELLLQVRQSTYDTRFMSLQEARAAKRLFPMDPRYVTRN